MPGAEYRSFVADGRITIVPVTPGGAWGHLAHVQSDPSVSEEASRQDALDAVFTFDQAAMQLPHTRSP